MGMTMYDTLLQLPLFQGLGQNDFTAILEKVKIQFYKHKAGETILEKGKRCKGFLFLLNGSLQCETCDKDGLFTLYERIEAPFLVEPYSLFGGRTEYVSTYSAEEACDTLFVDKSFWLSVLSHYEIIRINFLNILSNRAQVLNDRLWTNSSEELDGRIVDFVSAHSSIPYGEKRLKIKMDDLAKLLYSTRIRISQALNYMQGLQGLKLRRGEICIPDLMALKELLKEKREQEPISNQ